MLKVSELDHVLKLIEKNGNPGMTMLRLKKESGMYGTRLTHFIEKHKDIFTLTENGQMVNINTFGEHRGHREEILKIYEKDLSARNKKLRATYIAVAIALIAALAAALNGFFLIN